MEQTRDATAYAPYCYKMHTPAASHLFIIDGFLRSDLTYGDFFRQAPALNPCRMLVSGAICGVRVDNMGDPLMQEIGYLDKLADDLAKGKKWSRY